MRRTPLGLLLVLLTVVATAPLHAADTQPTLSFAIVPQQAASKIARLWGPILKYLSAQSGIDLKFKTAPDIPTFEKRVEEGDYDIAYMNPYHYVVFSSHPGYRAFAVQRDKKIVGILVARKGGTVTSIQDLQGAQLAFPSPAAFAASILPRAELARAGIEFTPNYVSSHDSVYRNVAAGFYPAGGGIARTLKATEPAVRGQLEVIWRSQGYTPHAFAAHPRVPAELVRRLRDAMVAMDSTEEGRRLLATIEFTGIAPAVDKDWDDVRALHIDLIKDSDPDEEN